MINKILNIARAELGYKEGSNNNTKYGADYGLNYNPWCQMFIWWIAQKAGIGEDIIPKTASCPTAYRWFTSRNKEIVSHSQAQPGDIVFFQWNGSKNADHVGIVETVQNGIMTTIEGNKNDAVERRQVNVNNSCIFAICRPTYVITSEEIKPAPENKTEIAQNVTTYIVQAGDTLSAIAQKYGTTYQELARINNIANPNLIHVGQVIKINGSNTVQDVQSVCYKVSANSGLWLLNANGKKVKAYAKGTEVEYVGEGYTKYGYNYIKVKTNDGNVGYMAKTYLA